MNTPTTDNVTDASNGNSTGNGRKLNQSHELREALGNGGFGEFVENNAPILGALFAIVVIAAVIYEGVQFVQKRHELSAAAAFYPVETQYSKLKEGFDRAKMQNFMPSAQAAAPAQAASGDLQKDYGTVLPELEKIANENAGTTAGAQAAMDLADIYINYKQPEKAVDYAKNAAEKLSSRNTLAPLARVLWGTALAQKGDCATAVTVWQQVIDNKSAAFLHPNVSLRSGLCYEKMNQNDKAAEMYHRVVADAEQTSDGQTAKTYLRAIDLKNAMAMGSSGAATGAASPSALPAAPAVPAAPKNLKGGE